MLFVQIKFYFVTNLIRDIFCLFTIMNNNYIKQIVLGVKNNDNLIYFLLP